MIRFFSSIPKIKEGANLFRMANVKRMDTHGNTFFVAENIPFEKAKQMENELEARGHKQTYWTEEIEHSNAAGQGVSKTENYSPR